MDRKGIPGRRLLGVLSVVAMVGTSVAPAMARDHGRYGYGYGRPGHSWSGYPSRYRHYRHYRHHHNGLDAGDVIGIAALIGAVAVIASAASRDKETRRERDRRYDGPYDGRDGYRGSTSEDEAVNLCVDAARREAERDGGYAEIRDVGPPLARDRDGWDVEGRVEQRGSYRDDDRETLRFSCSVRDGRVADVRLSNDLI